MGEHEPGNWGCFDAYPIVWEAYQRQAKPTLIAVARPHQLVFAGERVILDGSKSWSARGKLRKYEWIFGDGARASGAIAERTYPESGEFSEILKVTDASGNVSYDFAVIQVIDRSNPGLVPPTIHCSSFPTTNIRPNDSVTFKGRCFRTKEAAMLWDFGDGTPVVTTSSGRNIDLAMKDEPSVILAKDGYSEIQHRFSKSGDYIVRVQHRGERGQQAIGHLWVHVGLSK